MPHGECIAARVDCYDSLSYMLVQYCLHNDQLAIFLRLSCKDNLIDLP